MAKTQVPTHPAARKYFPTPNRPSPEAHNSNPPNLNKMKRKTPSSRKATPRLRLLPKPLKKWRLKLFTTIYMIRKTYSFHTDQIIYGVGESGKSPKPLLRSQSSYVWVGWDMKDKVSCLGGLETKMGPQYPPNS